MLDLYAVTQNSDYLTRATVVMKFCLSGELPTGGIQLNENPNHEKQESGLLVLLLQLLSVACAYIRLLISRSI